MNCLILFKTFVHGIKVFGTQATGHCPFHRDSRPSFSCNLETGLWICFAGCGSGNIYLFEKKVGIDRSKIDWGIDFSVNPKRTQKTNTVPELSIQRKRQAMKFHNYLMDNWNEIEKPSTWSIEVIKRTFTGFDEEQGTFTFIYTNQLGQATNIRWHKRYSVRGHGMCTLFPMHLCKDYEFLKPLFLLEGEKDVLTAVSLGYQAITATNGANAIPIDLSPIRNFENIYVLYDTDMAGRTGAKKIAAVIKDNFSKINVKITDLRIP